MKYTISIIVFFLILTGTAYGGAYFEDQPLSALRVTQTDPDQGVARVMAAGADSATVRIGDTVGQSVATITKIKKTFVVVKNAQGKTKLPVANSVVPDGNRIIFQ